MMQHQVALQARFNPETLERVLRVVRHRGFHICAMNMETAPDAQNINIELTVASPRPVELLFSQLSKLVDVACASRSSNPHHNKSAPERKGRKMTTKKKLITFGSMARWFRGAKRKFM